MNPLEALLQGYGKGASLGTDDEGAAGLLAHVLPKPADPEGYTREYAAGSPYQDYVQNFRRDAASAAKEHPVAYGAGSLAGGVPLALAVPAGAGGSAAARVASAGLTGGALGAVSGAGNADGSPMRESVGKGALLGGALGAGGGALVESLPIARQLVQDVARGHTPATAGARAGVAPNVAPVETAGPQLNYSVDRPANPPPRRVSGNWDMPTIPKAPKRGISESMIPASEDLADASHVMQGYENRGLSSPTEVVDAAKDAAERLDRMQRMSARRAAPKEMIGEAPVQEPAAATVRPPRKKVGKPEPAKEPAREAIQQEIAFPAPQKPDPHWLEGDLKPTKAELLEDPGINAAARVHFGEGRSAIFKPSQGAMTWAGVEGRTQAPREVAAHDVSRALFREKSPVPRTVERDFGEGPGSLQEWVPDTTPAARVEDLAPRPEDSTIQSGYQHTFMQAPSPEVAQRIAERGHNPDFQRTQLLDLVTANRDRHARNLLETATGKPVAIDNGYAFATPKEIRVPFENREYLQNAQNLAPEVNQDLQRASMKEVARATGRPGITKQQQRDALGRLADLRANPKQVQGLQPDQLGDWARVPYTKRQLPTQDLMEIERLTGGIPSRHVSAADAPRLSVPSLEGEQLSLEDLVRR